MLAPVQVGWIRQQGRESRCGLFATKDLPAGFKLGLLHPGSSRLSDLGASLPHRAANVHFRMRTAEGAVAGLQPIIAISSQCFNAMHLLNSALRSVGTDPNAKVAKGTNVVTLSQPVAAGEEILLQYLTKPILESIGDESIPSAAQAHPTFMKTA
eukprot:g80740.t1